MRSPSGDQAAGPAAAPRRRPPVGVADVLRASVALGRWGDVAGLMGFEVIPRPSAAPMPAASPPLPRGELPSVPASPPLPPREAPPPRPRRRLRLEATLPLKEAPLPVGDALFTAPPADPLFEPRWERDLVVAAAGVDAPDGPLDVEPLVADLAQLRAPTRLPRRPRPSLRGGAQLLIDRGDALDPFREDVQRLRQALADWVGPEKVEVLFYDDLPSRGVGHQPPSFDLPYRPWRPAAPGSPVVVLAGPVGAGLAQQWRAFAGAVGAAGCPWVVLSPWAARWWPPALRELLPLVLWDRGTTGAHLRAGRR